MSNLRRFPNMRVCVSLLYQEAAIDDDHDDCTPTYVVVATAPAL